MEKREKNLVWGELNLTKEGAKSLEISSSSEDLRSRVGSQDPKKSLVGVLACFSTKIV